MTIYVHNFETLQPSINNTKIVMISSLSHFEDISTYDEYDDLTPAAIIIESSFNPQETKRYLARAVSEKLNFSPITPTTFLFLINTNLSSINEEIKIQLKSKFKKVTKICLKVPSSISEFDSDQNIQILFTLFKFLINTKFYLFVPKSASEQLQDCELFSEILKFNSNDSGLILFEYDSYNDLLKAYATLISQQIDSPIYAISPRFIQEVKKLLKSEFYSDQIHISYQHDMATEEVIKQKSNNLLFPHFQPLNSCFYLSFEEIACKEPVNTLYNDLYPLSNIRHIQINHIKATTKNFLFEHPKTFIGFYDLFDLYQGYDYFTYQEPKLNLKIESELSVHQDYSNVNFCNDLFYIEVHQEPQFQIDSTSFYSHTFEQIFYCGTDQFDSPTILISYRNYSDFENAIYDIMSKLLLIYNIEDLRIAMPNEDQKEMYICFTLRLSHDTNKTADDILSNFVRKSGVLIKIGDCSYKIKFEKEEECYEQYISFYDKQQIKLFYPYNFKRTFESAIEEQMPEIKSQNLNQKVNEEQKSQNLNQKVNEEQKSQNLNQKGNDEAKLLYEKYPFQPKPNMFYIQFQEYESSKTPYHSTKLRHLYSIHGIKDLQRNYYLPNDPTEYSFMGFTDRDSYIDALNSPQFKQTAFNIKEYPNQQFVFIPKNNLFYLYVEENPKSKPLYPTRILKDAFGLRNIRDLQRNYYLPDQTKQNKIYTFIGFGSKGEVEQAKLSKSFLSCIISKVYEYQPATSNVNNDSLVEQNAETQPTTTTPQTAKTEPSQPSNTSTLNTKSVPSNTSTQNEKNEVKNQPAATQNVKQAVSTVNTEKTSENVQQKSSPRAQPETKAVATQQKVENTGKKAEKVQPKVEQKPANTTQPKTAESSINKTNSAASIKLDEKKPIDKKPDKDAFNPDEMLIYIFFKEKNTPSRPQPVKQEKKNLLGVKGYKNVQRFRYHPDKNDKILYTFFGFSSYENAEQSIKYLNAQYKADGAIEIYETTEALNKYKAKKEKIAKEAAEKEEMEQQKIASSPLQQIILNNYILYTQQTDEYTYLLNRYHLPNKIIDKIIIELQRRSLIDKLTQNVLTLDTFDCIFDVFTIVHEPESLEKANKVINKQLVSNNIPISRSMACYDSSARCVMIFEDLIPSQHLPKFIAFLKSLKEISEIDQNKFTSSEILTLLYYTSNARRVKIIQAMNDYLVQNQIAFDKKKYNLDHTIILDEKLLFNNNDKYFDIIINEIKAIGLNIVHVQRNALFVHTDGILFRQYQISKFSFIVLNSEKDKMTALNYINSVIYQKETKVLKYNTKLYYSRFEFQRAGETNQNKLLNKLKQLPGFCETLENVHTIESPTTHIYVGFTDEQSRKNAFGQLYMYFAILSKTRYGDLFVYNKKYFYIRIFPDDLGTFTTIAEQLGSPAADIQKDCVQLYEKQFRSFIFLGYETDIARQKIWKTIRDLNDGLRAELYEPINFNPEPEQFLYLGAF